MKTIHELRHEKRVAVEEARGLLVARERDQRAMTREEVLKHDNLTKKIAELEGEITLLEQRGEYDRIIAEEDHMNSPAKRAFAQSIPYDSANPDGAPETRTAAEGCPVFLRSAADLCIPRGGHPFGNDTGGFLRAFLSGRHDPRLIESEQRANMVAPPHAGGYLMPGESTTEIVKVTLETSMLLSKVRTYPLESVRKLNIPAFKDSDRSGGLVYGGMRLYWEGEGDTLTEANPKARQVTLEPHGLKGYCSLSNELIRGSNAGLVSEFQTMIGEAAGWAIDNAFLNGTGAGQPLGALNSTCPCTIEVAKETSQSADTLVYQNFVKMYSRMLPSSRNDAEWFITNDAVPQLLTMTIAVGTGGERIPAMRETDGRFTLLGRPVNFSEKMAALGDRGDVLFADWRFYANAMVGGMTITGSEHALFTSDKYAVRCCAYLDGGPLLESAITHYKGSLTTSAFVTLAERA